MILYTFYGRSRGISWGEPTGKGEVSLPRDVGPMEPEWPSHFKWGRPHRFLVNPWEEGTVFLSQGKKYRVIKNRVQKGALPPHQLRASEINCLSIVTYTFEAEEVLLRTPFALLAKSGQTVRSPSGT